MIVRPITSPAEAMARWPRRAAKRIREGLANEHALVSADDVAGKIATGDMLLWEVLDGAADVASFVTEIVSGSIGKAVYIFALGGSGMARWVGAVTDAVSQYARSIGALYIVEMGRRGWKRVLAQHGWTEGPTLMLKVA